MGQTYSVEFYPVFKNGDPSEFCKTVQKCIIDLEGRAVFNTEGLDLNQPFDCFKALTCDKADTYEDMWYCDFDASYGWESVLYEVFEKSMMTLDNGSYVDIYPDDGHVSMKMKRNKLVIKDK